ncbi:MAG: isopentenyl phosphate kinase family protein [Thermoplasmata archaeon]|nr:isopentenyl phosphate kinase family protein [Thermoplasmata archaeon]
MTASTSGERPLIVVKLGGSVITRKREVERPRPKVLARLAEEIASGKDRRVVILHGAGSFGHPGARKFGLARAPLESETAAHRARGAAIVATEVRRLHLLVLRALVGAGVSPASVPIATHARNREGQLVGFDSAPFADALHRGLSPVSFGDVVPDETWGASILSADTIAEQLVKPLRPARVIFVSDVPGILSGPSHGRRTVVRDLTDDVVANLRPTAGAPDVTGGIRGKAESMLRIANAGVDAGLISGLTDGGLSRALRGEMVYGSWAHARSG